MLSHGRVDLGTPALLEFRGPDAVRFLNGQLTQDVRRVVGGKTSLPSCVTDAKGKLQFRVSILENEGALWVACLHAEPADLEGRLTRYLIADDVEVSDLTGKFSVHHFLGPVGEPPAGVFACAANRFGVEGEDWWVSTAGPIPFPQPEILAEELEELRIDRGVPAWGRELLAGMLPPEALLDQSDISYQKGCYIGQEVISRIKSAGKVNRKLVRLTLPAELPQACGPLFAADGTAAGEITSISPLATDGGRHALAYLRRGATEVFATTPGAAGLVPVTIR